MTTNSNSTQITAIEEKAMQQKVGFLSSSAIQCALNTKGHVALYVNFDTDQASIKTDGLVAIDEIAKLLNKDAKLKLSVEGPADVLDSIRYQRRIATGAASINTRHRRKSPTSGVAP